MGDGFSFLDMLLILIFGSVDISYIVMEALTMAGFWKMHDNEIEATITLEFIDKDKR